MLTHNNNRVISPIFVVGAPRSGTTLTAKILGLHSRIFMPGETHFFEDIYARKKEFGGNKKNFNLDSIISRLSTLYGRYNEVADQNRIDLLFQDKEVKKYLLDPYKDYSEILSRFMEVQMDYQGKQRWGNNAPKDIFYARDIVSCFPDALFIICIRDARDFLRSYKTKWKTTTGARSNRLKSLYHPVVTSFLWKTSIKCIPNVKSSAKNRIYILPYENLVTNTESVVKQVCEFIGEDFEKSMLDVQTNNSSIIDNNRKIKGIYSSSIGIWRNELSNEEIFIAQIINGKDLVNLGYKLVDVEISWLRLLIILLSTPYALFKGLNANKQQRGPLIKYIIRRVSSLISRE